MTDARQAFLQARDRLGDAAETLGWPREVADLMARQLGSPWALDRMTGYLLKARPATLEMAVDEMLAIAADLETWRKKKEGREAQAAYNAWLGSDARWRALEEAEAEDADF